MHQPCAEGETLVETLSVTDVRVISDQQESSNMVAEKTEIVGKNTDFSVCYTWSLSIYRQKASTPEMSQREES
jgi:hypothetical protein